MGKEKLKQNTVGIISKQKRAFRDKHVANNEYRDNTVNLKLNMIT